MVNKISEIKAVATVLNHGENPFYAADLGLTSGDILSLKSLYLIKATGNSKQVMINVYDNHYIEVTAKEWEIRDTYREGRFNSIFERDVKAVFDLVEFLHGLGY